MSKQLPFSHDVFLDVFGAYNTQLWPCVVLLWVATAGLVWRWLMIGRLNGRVLFTLLAAHWGWSGIAYHWCFFRAINPAAAVFAVLFVVQSALFTWLAAGSKTCVISAADKRGSIGAALVLYGLLYPGIGFVVGLEYPRIPLFAVPCPTTIITAGFLIATAGVPRFTGVLPVLWAAIGGSAASILGIRADVGLAAAGAVLAFDMAAPSVLGRKAA